MSEVIQPEYIRTEEIDGITYQVDRRVVELQPNGTKVIRDPVTNKAWRADGNLLPSKWKWTDGLYD